jgi:hypothetical protein
MSIYTGSLPDVTFPVNVSNTGFNLVSVSDLGLDGEDDDGIAGTATVKAVCFNIQEIPGIIKDAGCELSHRSSTAYINPVCFRVENSHPWFNKLVPQFYDWSYVEVEVLGVKFLSQSEDYPSGIYSTEVAELLIGVTSQRLNQLDRYI